uniref:Uncharacterized protein n=1 Tax=Neolamprologus brichardi TaxID=32507 RepID=A0A3Q4HMS8_NEOBR
FEEYSCSFLILFLFYFCSQIDDKEFDIPQVDTPPTLESILNELEDEEEPFVLEDTCILNTDNMDAHSCETSSLASSDSGDPSHLKRHVGVSLECVGYCFVVAAVTEKETTLF